MDKNVEAAGKHFAEGFNELFKSSSYVDISLDSVNVDDLAGSDKFVVISQYEKDYPIHTQKVVEEYVEDIGGDEAALVQIYRHDDTIVDEVPCDDDNPNEKKAIKDWRKMVCFINERKDIRLNVVTGAAEWADKGTNQYVRIDKQQLQTMWTYLPEAGIQTNFEAFSRYCLSARFDAYNPLVEFMDALPEWDGHDHAGDFIRRLTSDEHCIEGMKMWMRAITAKMINFNGETPWANMMMPILVGAQGLKKTTFARKILPIDGFFAQNIDFSPRGDWMKKLTLYYLICDDEFDKHGDKQLATIKSALSESVVMMREPYAKHETPHIRKAAMIGTSNRTDLLRDETGSRRFLVIHINATIDLDTPIPYGQIYAQLKAELLAGKPYYPDKDYEKHNEKHNLNYYASNMVEEVFSQHFRFCPANRLKAKWMTTTDIYEYLCEKHPLLKKEKPSHTKFGMSLKPLADRYARENNVATDLIYGRRRGGSSYSVEEIQ